MKKWSYGIEKFSYLRGVYNDSHKVICVSIEFYI